MSATTQYQMAELLALQVVQAQSGKMMWIFPVDPFAASVDLSHQPVKKDLQKRLESCWRSSSLHASSLSRLHT